MGSKVFWLAAALLCTGARSAPSPTLIPGELLAQGPDMASVKVSPDGRRLALITTVKGRGAVVLSDIDGQSRTLIYRDPARSIDNVAWSGDGRWLYVFQDAGGNEGFHLFRLDPAKPGGATDLTPFAGSRAEAIATPVAPSSTVAITLDRRDREWPDAYSLDLATGKLTEQVRNTIGATEFFADRNGVVKAATATRSDGRLELLANDGAGKWQVRYVAPPAERFRVASLSPNGRDAIVRTNRGRAAEQLVRIDLASGRRMALKGGSCGRFDAEGIRFRADGSIAAVECIAERATLKPGDQDFAKVIRSVRAAAGARAGLSVESVNADATAAVFYADMSNLPGRFLRWSSAGVHEIGSTHPQLKGQPLAYTEARWLKARDGLELLAYVTRPIGATGPVPMIVSIHGGPWTRDTGGYSGETQLLANRGYAVLQVNFRGSTGMGRAVFDAGVGEFGRRMSDDIDDAVTWAIGQGIADADRVCLLGGSYGGYATLVGMVRQPGRYRCGVDYAGPVDLTTLMESFPPGWGPFLPRSWYRFVGDPTQPGVRSDLATRSPLGLADRMTAPLLIFQGANDPRVTKAQSDRIVCALRRRGVTVEYLLASNEGHSFGNEETGLAVRRATELFLAKQLGGRAEDKASPRTEAALVSLRSAGDAITCPAS